MERATSATTVRQRMQAIRQNLSPEVDEIVTHARELADWRYYVKAFPLGSLAAAATLGYLAIPRRLEIISPDAKTLESLAKKNKLVVEHKPTSEKKPSMAESLFTLTGSVLLRAGMAYVGQNVGKFFGDQAAGSQPAREHGKVPTS